jgi:hypothetical protein
MSWQAMEAVMGHSGFQERRDYSAFRVLLAIASFADENGVAGVSGEHRACPTHRAIGAKAGVHRNTVGNLLPQLVESGELTVEQGGWGGSLWTVYRLCLPGLGGAGSVACSPEEHVEGDAMGRSAGGKAQHSGGYAQEADAPEARDLAGMVRELAEGMGQLRRELAIIREAMDRAGPGYAHGVEGYAQSRGEYAQTLRGNAQNRGGNAQNRDGECTTVQRGVVPDPIRDPGDPDRDPGDPGARDGAYRVLHEDSPPFPADLTGLGEGGGPDAATRRGGQDARAPERRDLVRPALDGMGLRRAEAIAAVCGLDMRVRSHRKRCEEAAVQLTGYPEAYIVARYGPPNGEDGAGVEGWNWYVHDWRGRKGEQPEPRLVVETIGKVWVGDSGGIHGRQDVAGGAPAVMSNNETTARKYAELRRKMMED